MNVSWERFEVEPEYPFGISRSRRSRAERVWIRIEADGIEGWGEADPSAYYGETAGTVEAALETMRPTLEAADDPRALERLEAALGDALGHNRSAKAGVSAALHDWVGKRCGEPLWRLWGLDPGEAPTSSFTIGIDEPEVVAEKARRAREFPILKVKVGTDRDEDMLDAVRAERPEAVLRVDANGAWTAREATDRIARLADYDVEFVEQPLPPEDRAGLRFLHGRAALPIMLDESCRVATDIPGLVGLADGVVIKLAKSGGPREALRAVHTARACGLRVMLGCMLESSLGIAPAAHLAPLADYADLDGAALLRADPFRGPHLEEGRIVLGEEPGLGVRRA